MEKDELAVAKLLGNALNLKALSPSIGEGAFSFEYFQRLLEEKIRDLLDYDPERLFQLLYRIDVDERKVKQLFEHAAAEEIPHELANLMIKRQMQKVYYRKKFGHQGQNFSAENL